MEKNILEQKVIKDSRHPLKFGYRVQSRSQEKKMGEKEDKAHHFFL